MKSVKCENSFGNIKIFKSAKEAADYFKCDKSSISHACKGEPSNSCMGHNWSYHYEELENEVWLEHQIKVSNKGRIEFGYKTVTIGYFAAGYRNFKIGFKCYKVHRLVLETFKPYPNYESFNPQHLQTNHIDYDRSNNCVENLEWVSPAENIKHMLQRNKKLT